MSLFGSTQTTSQATEQDLANDITVPNGPEDSISDLLFSPQAEFLSVSSWDKKVRIYEVMPDGTVPGRAMYEHQGPVFSTHWSPDGTSVISGGADKLVRIFDLQSSQQQQIGAHDAAVKSVRYVNVTNSNQPVVVSGSWDKTLKYWDTRQQQPIATINLPERVYTMDSAQKLLVVGCAERHIVIIDLNNPQQIFKQLMSPLKWQTRTIGCYPQGNGYAVGSIEGRCAIQYVDEDDQSKLSYSFKCHRLQKSQRESEVYALNSIKFNPVYGTFSTAGSDGCFNFWDRDARHRLRLFPTRNATISLTLFNRSGTIFAYALSYDWSKGHQFNTADYPNIVKLHPTKEIEVKPRPKKR